MISRPPSSELRRYVDRLLEGHALTKLESAHLEQLLEDDASLAYYVQMMQQESLLPLAVEGIPYPAVQPETLWRKRVQNCVVLAAAACVIFAFGFFAGSHKPGTEATKTTTPAALSPARITGLVGIEWNTGREPDLVGKDGGVERLAFRTGLAELTYGNGVRVTVEGPADFTITGPNSARLDSGKLVAAVPKGAEGFSVDYAGGKVVDLGTEFALSTSAKGPTELGVFDGKVELHRPNTDVLSLTENQAVLLHPADDKGASAIPLNRDKFVRRIPNRDFRWEITQLSPTQLEFDVSHLVWKSANYRALFKWMQGADGMQIRDVGLYLDGKAVSISSTKGVTAHLHAVHDNMIELPVGPKQFQRGRWTVRATLEPLPLDPKRNLTQRPIYCLGIMQFEEGLVTEATAKDFIGTWTYNYAGQRFERQFFPDGTMKVSINGKLSTGPTSQSHWIVENGVLRLTIPTSPPQKELVEEHVLRDRDTLIFVRNPYDNAKRVKVDEK